MVTVYVIESVEVNRRYVGITCNLQRRLNEHRLRQSRVGKTFPSFKLLYTEEFPDHQSARRREKYLKSGAGRRWLLATFPKQSLREQSDLLSLDRAEAGVIQWQNVSFPS